MTPLDLLEQLQGSRKSLAKAIGHRDYLELRQCSGEWDFGMEMLRQVEALGPSKGSWLSTTTIAVLNSAALNAMWFKTPRGQLVGINRGLVDATRLIAYDVFGELRPLEDWPQSKKMSFADGAYERAAGRLRDRVGAFLETGFPLGLDQVAPDRGPPREFVSALVSNALQFVVLHEIAHLVLGHDRKPVALLENERTPAQLATYSMGQELQADEIALRLHMRLGGIEGRGVRFAGVVLFFSVLSLFERYSRYQQVYDTPHAHPPAFERLYRLRMAIQFGDGDRYFGLTDGEGVRLARADVVAEPGQLEFADVLSSTLIRVIGIVEGNSEGLFSPIMSALNRNADGELTQKDVEMFSEEVVRWMVLGSPARVAKHLGELYHHAMQDLKEGNVSDDDLQLFKNGRTLITKAMEKVAGIDHELFRTATKEFDSVVDPVW